MPQFKALDLPTFLHMRAEYPQPVTAALLKALSQQWLAVPADGGRSELAVRQCAAALPLLSPAIDHGDLVARLCVQVLSGQKGYDRVVMGTEACFVLRVQQSTFHCSKFLRLYASPASVLEVSLPYQEQISAFHCLMRTYMPRWRSGCHPCGCLSFKRLQLPCRPCTNRAQASPLPPQCAWQNEPQRSHRTWSSPRLQPCYPMCSPACKLKIPLRACCLTVGKQQQLPRLGTWRSSCWRRRLPEWQNTSERPAAGPW